MITERIRKLEDFVGAPLFHRNMRSVRLSELGQTFLHDCVELVGRTNEVVDQMREVTTAPVGRLRVHALPGFVLGHLATLLQDFQARHPQIVLDIVVNDAAIDPVKEGFDCALQVFPPRSEELISAGSSRCDGSSVRAPPTCAAPACRASPPTCCGSGWAGTPATRRASAPPFTGWAPGASPWRSSSSRRC